MTSSHFKIRHEVSSRKIISYAILISVAIVTLFPLYWMFVTAFQKPSIVVSIPPKLYPQPPSLLNFIRLRFASKIFRWVFNSAFVTMCQVVSIAFLATLAGYVLAKKRFPGHDLIFWAIVGTLLIPTQLGYIPLFSIVHKFGWVDTYWGLIVPEMVGPYAIFLMTQYLRTLPSEILDAARVDGCSELGIYWKIVLPLARPGIAVLVIFAFVWGWNSFFWPLLVTSSNEMRVLQIGLESLQMRYMSDYGLLMGGAVIAAAPVFIAFFSFQKYFLRGITVGALKA